MDAQKKKVLLRVENLTLHYRTDRGIVRAVDRVSFELDRGQALVVLGESGCGKTSLTRALLRILPPNTGEYSGRVYLDGLETVALGEEEFRRRVRWVRISLVMQAAMNAFNPVVRVGEQVAEPLRVHLRRSRREALERAAEVFHLVGIPPDFLARYPFEFSGGMRQRAALAMALAAGPDLVLLDEPTSALDVLSQGNIMNVLKRVKAELGTSFILITHDIAISSELADRVALMYAGQFVEESTAADFFRAPVHPYAKLLLASVPLIRQNRRPEHIPGRPPNLFDLPGGCRFAERCPDRFERCAEDPGMIGLPGGRHVRCQLYRPERTPG